MDNIAFIGFLGCGKTTWCEKLKALGYNVIFENLEEVSQLKTYWKNYTCAFQAQIEFYSMWLKQYGIITSQDGGFMDSSILAHHLVFTNFMFKKGYLGTIDFEICDKLFHSIFLNIKCKWVFLYCDLPELYHRIRLRDRNNEKNDLKFLNELRLYYEKIIQNYQPIIIDITDLSPDNPDHVNKFVNMLKKEGIL